MVICSRCKKENDDNVKFCSECGNDLRINMDVPAQSDLKELANSLNKQALHTEKQSFNLNKMLVELPKKSIFFRKKKNTIITFASAIVLVMLIIGVLNSGYVAFTTAYNMEKYDVAQSVQNWSFNSDTVKNNINNFVIGKMQEYYDDFLNEKSSYDDTVKKFETANEFYNKEAIRVNIDKLQASREAFKKAKKFEKKNDIYNATIEYLKVIEADKNYSVAQEKIKKYKAKIKKQAISQMKAYVKANNFREGIKIVSKMEKIFTNDADINRYKNDFYKQKKAYKMEKLKDKQKVRVLSATTFNDGYYTILRKGKIILKNCGNKVLKEATVVLLQFDNNGYPVDAEYSMYAESEASNSYRCGANSINIKPGDIWGNSWSYNIADNATKIKACVKSAEFYDGGIWTNPYYEYWLQHEKDRY